MSPKKPGIALSAATNGDTSGAIERRTDSSDIRSTAADAAKLTFEDLRRAAGAAMDLDDPQVMETAWR